MRSIFFMTLLLVAGLAQAATITVTAADRGFYGESIDPAHFPSNEVYGAGFYPTPDELRNFFVFDLSSISENITSARFDIEMGANGFISTLPSETLAIYSYDADIGDLVAGVADFATLGSGEFYGQLSVSESDIGQILSIELSAAALADIKSASGLFAFSGKVLDIAGPDIRAIFGGSPSGTTNLVLQTVPVPAAVWLFGSALAGLGWVRRRQAV